MGIDDARHICVGLQIILSVSATPVKGVRYQYGQMGATISMGEGGLQQYGEVVRSWADSVHMCEKNTSQVVYFSNDDLWMINNRKQGRASGFNHINWMPFRPGGSCMCTNCLSAGEGDVSLAVFARGGCLRCLTYMGG